MRRRRSAAKNEGPLTQFILDTAMAAVAKGADPERVEEKIGKVVPDLIEEFGPFLASQMIANKKALRKAKKADEKFHRRLQKRWCPALDLYFLILSVSHEVGEAAAREERSPITDSQEYTLEALTRLHASACRVAGEVYTLLAHGHPKGALARCRTLHETAVIACVIAEFSNDPDHCDLAERFLDHEIVTLRRDARQFQADHVLLGEEPLEQEFLDQLEDRYREVARIYGSGFVDSDYGWAKRLVPAGHLRALEDKASLSYVRPHYQWASSEVHCGARGLAQGFSEYRGMLLRDSGKTNVGLADPAQMALSSLLQVTSSFVLCEYLGNAEMETIISVKALIELRDACVIKFDEVQAQIDSDEERILLRLNRSRNK
ncbi:DUF5677 domain-containing protein [Streptomyces sp. NPDC087422]|uniref:DUF5677 domain-containing protein n=1 Tax=Streptomyces sp. NPDC087422 TaxID=3365786 RepID=UPI0037FA3679